MVHNAAILAPAGLSVIGLGWKSSLSCALRPRIRAARSLAVVNLLPYTYLTPQTELTLFHVLKCDS